MLPNRIRVPNTDNVKIKKLFLWHHLATINNGHKRVTDVKTIYFYFNKHFLFIILKIITHINKSIHLVIGNGFYLTLLAFIRIHLQNMEWFL